MYKHTFFLNSTKCGFCLFGPIEKICQLTKIQIHVLHVSTVVNCWQWAKITVEPYEQNQHFAGLKQKVCLFIYAVSAPKMFAKF